MPLVLKTRVRCRRRQHGGSASCRMRASLAEEQRSNAERASRQDAARERLLSLQVRTCLQMVFLTGSFTRLLV